MTYLIMQMLFCLLIAAAIGAILGWLLRSWLAGDSAALKASLADFQTRLGLAEKSAKDAHVQLSHMSGKLGLAEKDAADARLQLGDWRMKFEGAEKEATGLRSNLLNVQGAMESSRAEWDAKVAAGARAADDLRAKLASLSADHERVLSMEKTQSLGLISNAESALKARLAKAEAETLDVRRALDGAEAEIARLKNAAAADAQSDRDVTMRFSNEEADLKTRIANSERQIAALGDDIARYRNRIGSLEADLGTCGSARAALQAELDALKAAPAMAPMPLAAAPVMAVPAMTTTAKAAPMSEDDLKDIVGIGPVLERQLHAAGIKTFRDLARMTPQGVLDLADKLDHVFGDRITRERWVEQAADLHRKKYGTEP